MCSKTPRGAGKPGYHSIMCSTPEQRIAQIGQAIDDLAARARTTGTAGAPDAGTGGAAAHASPDGADTDDVFRRLAELWAQLAQLDPEVGRRLPTYEA